PSRRAQSSSQFDDRGVQGASHQFGFPRDRQRNRVLTVTSSSVQEGKSITAANLSIVLAEAGMRVVLVDCDLRRPRVAEYLGIEGGAGLSDVLVGRAELDDVLQYWGENGLHA